MILANLTKAIRKQNWFAVAVEFLIVIAGVVIGFQITAWNEERENREKETSLLLRLHGEVEQLIESRELDTFTMQNRLQVILDAYEILLGRAPMRPLSDAECFALVLAHDFYYPQVTLPSLNEALASGQFDLISNVTLRTELSRYLQISEQALAIHEMMIAGSDRLGAEHQEYFANALKTVTDEEMRELALVSRYESITITDRMVTTCDVEGMATDDNFIGDVADLVGKSYAYDSNATVAPARQLEIVRGLLEAELVDKGYIP